MFLFLGLIFIFYIWYNACSSKTMEVFDLLSEEAVLRHMKEELERALGLDDVQKQREHVRAVRSMCDLFLQSKSSERPVKTQVSKPSEAAESPSAAEWAAMTGEWPPQQPSKKAFEDDDEESNGKSLFDF
jgi:hypothetical protein